MPTNDETLQQGYQREHNDHLKALAKYTPEQIAAVEVDLNNAAATIAQLRAVLRGLVDDIQGLIAESDGVAGLHLNGDVAPWGELEAGGQFEWLSHLPAAIEAAQCSEVGRKCAELPAQCSEPVNQQLLVALKDCEARLALLVAAGRGKLLDAVAAEKARAAIAAAELSGNSGQLPAAEAAHPVAQQYLLGGRRFKVTHSQDHGFAITGLPQTMNGQWVAFVDATDNCHMQQQQQPASAQPVAVPAWR